MTRENLLQAIYDNMDDWSCQYTCSHTMEEENPQVVCMECAERLLAEYEQKIRADAIDEFVDAINVRLLKFVPTDSDDVEMIAKYLKEKKQCVKLPKKILP